MDLLSGYLYPYTSIYQDPVAMFGLVPRTQRGTQGREPQIWNLGSLREALVHGPIPGLLDPWF